jgi:hypothetical protein
MLSGRSDVGANENGGGGWNAIFVRLPFALGVALIVPDYFYHFCERKRISGELVKKTNVASLND